jgi:hypothetical protein
MSRNQQATIDALGIQIAGQNSTIATLESENARLREALRIIAEMKWVNLAAECARAALEAK